MLGSSHAREQGAVMLGDSHGRGSHGRGSHVGCSHGRGQ